MGVYSAYSHTNSGKSLWHVTVQSQETVQVNAPFEFRFELLNMDTRHRGMGDQTGGDTTSQCVEQMLNRIGAIIFPRQDRRFVAVKFKCLFVLHRLLCTVEGGPGYIASRPGEWLKQNGIAHTRGEPCHPMTQGKSKRYHRSMKNQIRLENYCLPGEPEVCLAGFVDYYTHERRHESLDNFTPADVYFGRSRASLEDRARIKQKTIALRRKLHQQLIA